MLFSVEQVVVGRDEKRAPLKTPAWEARVPHSRSHLEVNAGGLWDTCVSHYSRCIVVYGVAGPRHVFFNSFENKNHFYFKVKIHKEEKVIKRKK